MKNVEITENKTKKEELILKCSEFRFKTGAELNKTNYESVFY